MEGKRGGTCGMRVKGKYTRILVGVFERKTTFGRLGIDGKMLLKFMRNKKCLLVWTWFRVGRRLL